MKFTKKLGLLLGATKGMKQQQQPDKEVNEKTIVETVIKSDENPVHSALGGETKSNAASNEPGGKYVCGTLNRNENKLDNLNNLQDHDGKFKGYLFLPRFLSVLTYIAIQVKPQ